MVLEKTKVPLEAIRQSHQDREIRVAVGDDVLWSRAVDPDARVTWDSVRGLLRIDES